jgi:hypothetical protein
MQRALWGPGVAAESLSSTTACLQGAGPRAAQPGAAPRNRIYFSTKVSLILTVYSAILPLFTFTS